MRCANCDAEIPADSRFCIECGAPAAQAATGATERLPEHANGRECQSCGTRNPPNAAFCFACGRALGSPSVVDAPSNPLPPAPEPMPLSYAPTSESISEGRPRRGRFSVEWGGVMGGIWLIGIAVLAVTGWWWPGIMVLIGISALVGGFQSGQGWERWGGVQGAIWTFGIAVLAVTGWWWPGIMVLVGLSAILGALSRNDQTKTS